MPAVLFAALSAGCAASTDEADLESIDLDDASIASADQALEGARGGYVGMGTAQLVPGKSEFGPSQIGLVPSKGVTIPSKGHFGPGKGVTIPGKGHFGPGKGVMLPGKGQIPSKAGFGYGGQQSGHALQGQVGYGQSAIGQSAALGQTAVGQSGAYGPSGVGQHSGYGPGATGQTTWFGQQRNP
ncbi:hypothetical protein [Sorangium sp. So ce362]|uniref:hypothetical protein n=1 Tax=Sorangium sp. So ce362 TaxID=3133303 RepID=UPI003F600F0F